VKLNSILFILILSLTKCKSTNDFRKFEKYDSEGIKEIGFLNKDSVLVGRHNYYFPSGQLKCKENYVLGKIDGFRENYYPNGKIQQLSFFQNGLIESWTYNFNNKGELTSKTYWLHGIQVGDTYSYYEGGNVQQYLFLDYKQRNLRIIYYDKSGMINDTFGDNLFVDSISFNKSNDSISLGILVSHPPKTKSNLKLLEFDLNGKVLKKNLLDSTASFIQVRRKIQPQLYKYNIVLDQYDSILLHKKTQVDEIILKFDQ
jgi:hypothetical protein